MDYQFNKRDGGPMFTLFDISRYLFIFAVLLAIAYALSGNSIENNPLLKMSFFCALAAAAARHWFIKHQMPGGDG